MPIFLKGELSQSQLYLILGANLLKNYLYCDMYLFQKSVNILMTENGNPAHNGIPNDNNEQIVLDDLPDIVQNQSNVQPIARVGEERAGPGVAGGSRVVPGTATGNK